jgi:thiosulfate/3-mercaptopyruvate sulfurtransferase
MTRKILFTPSELHAVQLDSDWVVFDCRFYLNDTEAGLKKYLQSHIPGAIYAHLDNDLAGVVTGCSGRHPLPSAEHFASFLARSGWRPGKLVAIYDDAGGSIAARLWWLMKYFGHDCAALLDGGIDAWREAGFELQSGHVEADKQDVVKMRETEELALSTADVFAGLGNSEFILADARASERFKGEIEPIDPVAGHIPGSVNYPNTNVLTANRRVKPAEELRQGFKALLGNRDEMNLVHMCGSGVTACLNIFAAELAGYKKTKLYVGSWSEWIRDPSRPVETGR